MKKLFAICLSLIMLISCFASCDSGTNTPSNTDTVQNGTNASSAKLSDYLIVRADACTDSEKAAATALRLGLSDAGVKIKVSADSSVTDKSDKTYEILIGSVDREQTEQVLSSLNNRAVWTIEAVGNKIVITSPFDVLLDDAVEYFIATLLPTAVDGVLTLEGKIVSDEYSTVTVVDNGVLQYRVIRRTDAPTPITEGVDALVKILSGATGKDEKYVLDTSVSKSYNSDTKDIIIGNTCLTESAEELETLGTSSYGIAVRGNKLLVLGSVESCTNMALELFTSRLQTLTNSDGTKDIVMLYDAPVTVNIEGYYLDFPRPTGLTYVGNLDCGNNHMQYLWDDAESADFTAYRAVLENAGYTLYTDNQIGNNLYATYTGNGGMLHTYYTASEDTLRVISAPLDGTVLFPKESEAYTKVTDTAVAMLTLSYNPESNNGMSFVYTLEDGSYLIFDGGENADHAERLYNYLVANNKRTDGKLVIAGWLLSHAHTDHYGAFTSFVTQYGKQVEVEYIFANGYTAYGVTHSVNTALTSKITGYQNAFANGDTKIVKVHSGQKISLRNVTFDILQTHEDFYPSYVNDANDTSTVVMVHIAGKKILMTADAHTAANSKLVKNFDSALQCDILQVPHHGHSGMLTTLVDSANPTYAFFPTGNVGYAKYKISAANKYLIQKVGESNVFVADGEHTVMTFSN